MRGGFFSWKREPEKNPQELWQQEEKLSLEDRRKRYHCYSVVEVDKIPNWQTVSQALKWKEGIAKERRYLPNKDLNEKIALFHGDITEIECDAIVNAANEGCLGGGGIDGAIHRAAGNTLYEECRTLHGCPTGKTKITRGYDLPAKYVLHTVGPIGEDSDDLKSCYLTCLELVVKHQIKTVVFCGVSTGIFGYPLYPASHIALNIVRQWLEKDDNKDKVDKIVFCTFLYKEKVCYDTLTPLYFPPVPLKPDNNSTAVEKKEPELEDKHSEQEDKNSAPDNEQKQSGLNPTETQNPPADQPRPTEQTPTETQPAQERH